MSTGMAVAALYTCTMSSPAALDPVPEDSEAKKHHVNDGKGFTNPWESWKEMSTLEAVKAMIV